MLLTHSYSPSILKISDFKFLTIRNEFSFNINKFIIIIIQNLSLINKSKNWKINMLLTCLTYSYSPSILKISDFKFLAIRNEARQQATKIFK